MKSSKAGGLGGPRFVRLDTTPAAREGGKKPQAELRMPDTVRQSTSSSASRASRKPLAGPFALRIEAARTKEAELEALAATLADDAARPEVRGPAGLELALRRLGRDLGPDGGERALDEALQVAPHLAQTPSAQKARALVRLGRGDTHGAQAILRTLLAASPRDPELRLLEAEVMRQLGQAGPALHQLAEVRADLDPKAEPRLAAQLAFQTAYCSFTVVRPEDALREARRAFELGVGPAKDTRIACKASQLLRELVCPDFHAPQRAEVEAGLSRATAAFQAGDWDAVQVEAQSILHKDPDEALAFHLFAVAEQRRVDDRPLIGLLATAERRAALVDKLEAELAALGASPDELFPDWPGLNDVQRAKVAHSALLYGDLMPEILARRPARKIHLVPPGESCTTRDPDTDRRAKHDGFGRHWYGTRGWVGRRDVVVGLEDVEAAARGGYDTVTHELAHLAQEVLEARGLMGAKPNTRIALMKQGLGPDNVRSFKEALDWRFKEARKGITAQPVTDYAGTCVEEYFAESMMASAQPEPSPGPNRQRLEARDVKMAALVAGIFADISRLPK